MLEEGGNCSSVRAELSQEEGLNGSQGSSRVLEEVRQALDHQDSWLFRGEGIRDRSWLWNSIARAQTLERPWKVWVTGRGPTWLE